jgi:hypothetical protein
MSAWESIWVDAGFAGGLLPDNSFVIQPMLLDVLRHIGTYARTWEALLPDVLARARRYAAIQERLISPEGTFPAASGAARMRRRITPSRCEDRTQPGWWCASAGPRENQITLMSGIPA